MRMSTIAEGHVVLRSPRRARWIALVLSLVCLLGAIQWAHAAGRSPVGIAAAIAAAALFVLAAASLLCSTEIEISPGMLLVRRSSPCSDLEVSADRAAIRHLRIRRSLLGGLHGERGRAIHGVELVLEHPDLPGSLVLFQHHRLDAALDYARDLARLCGLSVSEPPAGPRFASFPSPHPSEPQPERRAPVPDQEPAGISEAEVGARG
ncbi:MAG: hypothetical protein Fur0037_29450 [Planctomycetota bacterium]